jgi:hypothetical protein
MRDCRPFGAALRGEASNTTITIGIGGPDAQERINQLRHALAKLITKHGWARPRPTPLACGSPLVENFRPYMTGTRSWSFSPPLTSAGSSCMTGAEIIIDGGWGIS